MKQYWVIISSIEELESVLNRAAQDGWQAITVHPPESTRVTNEYRSGQRCRVILGREVSESARTKNKNKKRLGQKHLDLELSRLNQQESRGEEESRTQVGKEIDDIMHDLVSQSLN